MAAYEVTATRKRPQDFERLVGQDFVVSTLENAIKAGRIAHAYLFSGPRGVGKTSSARLLAKALNCEKGPTPHPCCECSSCVSIAQGKAVDVIEIDGASNTSVNDIRAIKEEVMYPPQSSRYKIYIIDEVHMLSTSAFNALLKTIEEPPEYIIFIFATTELQKVPATIRSRCQQFRFHLISQELIMKCLRSAADDLGIEADEDALFWIARESTGSMRDAYTLFDQVAAFSGNHITLAGIREKLSIAGFGAVADIMRKTLSGDREGTADAIGRLFSDGVSADQIIKDSAEFFRTLMLYRAGVRRPDILGAALSDIPEDIASMLSEEQIQAALKAFLDLYRDIRYSLSPRLEIELMFMRLSSLPLMVSPESLVKKLEEMKAGVMSGAISVKKPMAISAPPVQMPSPAAERTAPPESIPEKPAAVPERREEKREEKLPEEKAEDTAASDAEEDAGEICGEIEERKLTLSDLGAVAEALRKMGKATAARYVSSIVRIEGDGEPYVLTVSKPLAYNSLRNEEKNLVKAIASATGEQPSIKLSLEEKERNGDAGFSSQMKELKAFFGGSLIKTEETEKDTEETNVPESEPIRTYEDNGLDTEPDEDD